MRKKFFSFIIIVLCLFIRTYSKSEPELKGRIQNRLSELLKMEKELSVILKRPILNKTLTYKRHLDIRLNQDRYTYAVETKEIPDMYFVFDQDTDKLYQWVYDLKGEPSDIFKHKKRIDIPFFLFERIEDHRIAYPFRLNAYNTPLANLVTGVPIDKLNIKAFDRFKINRPFLEPKNMVDTKKQIDYLNSLKEDNDLTFSGKPENPSYKCYFYSLSSYIDNILYKMAPNKLKSYTDFLNGKKNIGISPRFLELCYRELSKKFDSFKITSKLFFSDPVTNDGIAYSLKAAMEITAHISDLPPEIYDPVIPNSHFKRDSFKFLENLEKINTLINVDENIYSSFKEIKSAIDSRRFLLGGIGLRYMGSEFRTSAHAVMICGYAEYEDYKFLIYQDIYGKDDKILLIPYTYFREIYYYDTPYKLIKKNDILYLKNIFNNREKPEYFHTKDKKYIYVKNRDGFDCADKGNIAAIKPFFADTIELSR